MPERKAAILIVDDEEVVRDSLFHWFESEGYQIETASCAAKAFERLEQTHLDLIVTDIRMPGMDGLELLERIERDELDVAVIVMTGYASVETAVRALKHGAFDYVMKPFDPDQLSVTVRNALEQLNLKRENRNLRTQLAEIDTCSELIGQSDAMRRVREQIETVAQVDSTVLVEGESGTGKELVARAIHRISPRRHGPLVVAHCGALPESLIETELFGHERGAFTGAQFRKRGKFEAAAGGTIFLDEVADISLRTQSDLLRVLQEHEIVRVGATQPVHVDFRVVAATNRDLSDMAKEGLFRPDLYYRLNVFHIRMPALRERHGDVPLLAMYFLEKFNRQMNRKFRGFDRAALERLSAHQWPGNVRELENVIERAVVVGKDLMVRAQDIALGPPVDEPADRSLAALEKAHIHQVLLECGWNQSQAARELGINRVTLYHKIRQYGFQAPDARHVNGAK
jgi:DNA-binding NtrC family response regulator